MAADAADMTASTLEAGQGTISKIEIETCENCGESIGALEMAHLYDGRVVCGRCLGKLRSPPPMPQAGLAVPVQPITVQVIAPQQQWSPGVAAVLSPVIPGAGQMYKGQVFNGLAWLVMVFIGYLLFVIPGLVLHLSCIIGAASGNPAKK